MSDAVLRLATRGSPLALWQARRVAELLGRHGRRDRPWCVVETMGDRRLDIPLDRIGGQGVFVKEVQAAVVSGQADAAVHSAKDLPASAELGVPGLVLAAFPERADARDVLVGRPPRLTCRQGPRWPPGRPGAGPSWPTSGPTSPSPGCGATWPPGWTGWRGRARSGRRGGGQGRDRPLAMVGTGRGEIEVLEPETMLPQVGQGALAVECRTGDDRHPPRRWRPSTTPVTRSVVSAERAFLAELGGGCTLPVGAYAQPSNSHHGSGDRSGGTAVTLRGMLASGDGLVVLRPPRTGDRPEELGRAVARYLLDERRRPRARRLGTPPGRPGPATTVCGATMSVSLIGAGPVTRGC